MINDDKRDENLGNKLLKVIMIFAPRSLSFAPLTQKSKSIDIMPQSKPWLRIAFNPCLLMWLACHAKW